MSKAIAKQRPAPASAGAAGGSAARKQKVSSFLVTSDDELWPQIGAHLTQKLGHRQIDSVDELLAATRPGESAVVLWDARGSAEPASVLARLQTHSPRFAIVALDLAERASAWSPEVERGQIMGLLCVPFEPDQAASMLASAYDEANARIALLGEPPAEDHGTSAAGASAVGSTPPAGSTRPAGSAKPAGSRLPLIAGASLAAIAIAIAALGAYYFVQRDTGGATFAPAPASGPAAGKAASSGAAPATAVPATEEKVDTLIAQAQLAMRDRHFIDPAEGSALSLYRSALALDPTSGEARQGLRRLAEVLVARVQTALDEKQYEAALQALETARNIDANDPRLPALDERIARMRDELGPAEIQAAINAQNFDRAAQLIDQAARGKTLSEPKLAQLREDLRRHRSDSAVSRLLALADARLQQDELTEPAGDSASYYLTEARKEGAGAVQIQTQFHELVRRLTAVAHTAIEQRRFNDADRIAAELHAAGAPLSSVAAVQRDIGVARAQQAREPSDQSRDAPDAAQPGQAQTSPPSAGTLASSAGSGALADRARQAEAVPSSGPKAVAEASLTRTRKLDIEYPSDALDKKIEGSVELGYIVTAKGAVSDVKVLDSNPTGIFEKSAVKAVERLRYQPVMDGGKATAVSTKVLLIFRMK
jgi:periplasmic protein TonB